MSRRQQQEGGGILSRAECQRIVERALAFSHADGCEVDVNANVTGNIRFAANQLSTSGWAENVQVVVQSSFGPKHAVTTTNDLSDESLRHAVEESERLARLAPDDPEAMPALPQQRYTGVNAWFDATANLTPEARARAALVALEETRRSNDLVAAGFLVRVSSQYVVELHADGAYQGRQRLRLGRGG
jgi:predicted Zn-dependent protease